MSIYAIDSWDNEQMIIKANDKKVFERNYT